MLKTKKEIIEFLQQMKIENYIIHNDLVVDVNGNVEFSIDQIDAFPIQFGIVTGSFICSGNNLTSLKGAPLEVGVVFDCSFNNLTSLDFAPIKAGYVCVSHNKLTTLKGSPEKVNSDFDCSDNQLTTLEGAPKEIGGNFICSSNNLTSLKYSPKKIKKLDCSYNPYLELDDDFFDLEIKQSFIHRNPSNDMLINPNLHQIQLFKDYYDVNNFLILKAEELNKLIQPYKEKKILEKKIEESTNIKTIKLKV